MHVNRAIRPNVVVLGGGYLGDDFRRHGYSVWGRDRFEIMLDASLRFDEALLGFDVIVNCVGKSNTRWCERSENWQETLVVNGHLPALLSDLCRKHGQRLVHISSGCLYDRNDRPQSERDPIVSHCRYTASKLVGDSGLDPSADLILRPRLFFNGARHRKNLLLKLRGFSAYVEELNSYSHTSEVVRATEALLCAGCVGVFNVACDGYMTVREVAHLVGLSGPGMTAEELCRREKLHLVNVTMDLSKLKEHYAPTGLPEGERHQRPEHARRSSGRL